MKAPLPLALAALALAGCTAMVTTSATAPMAPPGEMRIAFDLHDAKPEILLLKLETVDLTRKQLLEAGVAPRMVLAFRGEASYYTQTDLAKVNEADRAAALRVRAKLRELAGARGIESLEQCNVPLKSRKILPADLMPEVKLVPNGWIALAGYQAKGYAYIAP